MKHFNEDQIINLIQTVGKIGGSVLGTYSATTQNTWGTAVGFSISLVCWWFSHHSNATPSSPPAPGSGASTPPAAVLKVLAFGLVLAGLASGCKSGATVAASAVNGAVVTTVDAAMTGWASYTQTHTNVSAASILAVSNAYQVYYNSELVLSNLSTVYVSNPTTNAASLIGNAVTTIGLSATNLLNIVQQLSK